MSTELATHRPVPAQPSPFRKALNLISNSPKAEGKAEEEEEERREEAQREIEKGRANEEEEEEEGEEEGEGQTNGETGPMFPGHPPEPDALAQLMANFAQQQNGGQHSNAAAFLPPHLGQPLPDFHAAFLAQCPPPPFGPHFASSLPPQSVGGGQMPPFPFPLDPTALAAIQPFMVPPEHGRRKNATREVTAPLKHWLNEHRKNPYPTKAEKTMLAVITRMTMTQVSTWFANARRRLKKENKMTWSPRNRPNEDEEEGMGSQQGEGPSGSSSPLGTAEEARKRGERKRGIWSIAETLAESGEEGRRRRRGEEEEAEDGEEEEEEDGRKRGGEKETQFDQFADEEGAGPPPALPLHNGHHQPPLHDGFFPPGFGLPPQLALGLGLPPPCPDPNLLFALAAHSLQNGAGGPRLLPLNPFLLLAQQLAFAQPPIKSADQMGAQPVENGSSHSPAVPPILQRQLPPCPPQQIAGQKRAAPKSIQSLNEGIPLAKKQCQTTQN